MINADPTVNSTVATIVQKVIVVETTMIPTAEHKVEQTTVSSTTTPTTTIAHKILTSAYVEPPPHPLGYCIRSRLRCTKIRRCCNGPCDVNSMKCP